MGRPRKAHPLLGASLLVLASSALADPPDATTEDVSALASGDGAVESDARGTSAADALSLPGMDATTETDVPDASDGALDGVVSETTPPSTATSSSLAAPAPSGTEVPGASPEDVADYALEATLDPRRHEVTGRGTLRWRNSASVPVEELWFHLYLNGFTGEHTVFMRTTGGEHRGNRAGAWGGIEVRTLRLATGEDLLPTATFDPAVPEDTSQLRVRLPRPVQPGETISLAMGWTSRLPEVFARTGYHGRFHLVGQWFPKLAVLERDGRWAHFPFHGNSEFYSDFGTYDVTLNVPRGWVVGATGEPSQPRERAPEGDRVRYRAARVHDFVWTTWDAFRERTATAGQGVRLRVLFPPGQEAAAERNVRVLQAAMPVFVRRFGDYPYPNLTVVLPPEGGEGAGGMEYPTFITTGGAWWHPEGVRFTEVLAVHEYAHQYFYGLLASDEHASPFLDEGLAEYAAGVVLEELYPPGGAVVDLLGFRLGYFALEGAASAAIPFPRPVATGADSFPTFGSYASHVYNRTATVLRTAELTWGRAAVEGALRRYAERQRFHHPTPEDLLAAFRETLGERVSEGFLRPALLGVPSLDYAVESVTSHRVRAGHYTGRATFHRRGNLEVPVEVELERQDGARTLHRWDGHGEHFTVDYTGPVPLRAARIDPHHRVPLDEHRLNDARLAPSEDSPNLPLAARVSWWLALALQAVGP